jgi:NTP pyrophosphatase (non-canonical NTP hydrolase)
VTEIAERRQNLVIQVVRNERARQDAKWGAGHHLVWTPHIALAVLVEEVGEVAKAINDGTEAELSNELIQVAAVAIAALEGILARSEGLRWPARETASTTNPRET